MKNFIATLDTVKTSTIPANILKELENGIGIRITGKVKGKILKAELLTTGEEFTITQEEINIASNPSLSQISKKEFDKLASKTRLNDQGNSKTAAEIFFVEGINNKAKCGNLLGLSRQASSQAIKRIEKQLIQYKEKELETNNRILEDEEFKELVSDIKDKVAS